MWAVGWLQGLADTNRWSPLDLAVKVCHDRCMGEPTFHGLNEGDLIHDQSTGNVFLAVALERDEYGSALKALSEHVEVLEAGLRDQEEAWEAEYDGWLVMQAHFRSLPDVDLWDSKELLAAIDGRLLAIGERRAALRQLLD